MDIITLKTITDARFYFNDNILPNLAQEVEEGTPIEELFNMWLECPTDYEPTKIIKVEELEDTKESDNYDLATHDK